MKGVPKKRVTPGANPEQETKILEPVQARELAHDEAAGVEAQPQSEPRLQPEPVQNVRLLPRRPAAQQTPPSQTAIEPKQEVVVAMSPRAEGADPSSSLPQEDSVADAQSSKVETEESTPSQMTRSAVVETCF